MITPTDIGDRELGSTVIVPFNSANPSTGAPETIAGAAFQIIELQTKSAYSGAALTPDPDIVTGLHRVSIDTGDSFFLQGRDYTLVPTAGTVGGVSVVGVICGTFSIGTRADGLVLDRSLKCHRGTIAAVGTDTYRECTLSFPGRSTVDDIYRGLRVEFQTGTHAGAKDGVIHSYTGSTGEVLFQRPLAAPIELGAEFKLVPLGEELAVYTAQIEVEWGIGQSAGDRISVALLDDGSIVTDPAAAGVTQMQLQTWDWDTGTALANTAVSPAASGVYKYTSPLGDARPPNQGLDIRTTFTIDGKQHVFGRSLFNFV